MILVVKANTNIEPFSEQKLRQSLEETFRIVKLPSGQTDDLIRQVMKEFKLWYRNKSEITTNDIRLKIGQILKKIHPDASYIFLNFKKVF